MNSKHLKIKCASRQGVIVNGAATELAFMVRCVDTLTARGTWFDT